MKDFNKTKITLVLFVIVAIVVSFSCLETRNEKLLTQSKLMIGPIEPLSGEKEKNKCTTPHAPVYKQIDMKLEKKKVKTKIVKTRRKRISSILKLKYKVNSKSKHAKNNLKYKIPSSVINSIKVKQRLYLQKLKQLRNKHRRNLSTFKKEQVNLKRAVFNDAL